MILFPFGESATLSVRVVTGRDSDGNDVYGSSDTVVDLCGFDPGLSSEIVGGQDTVTTQPTLYMPPGSVAGHVDTVTVRGVTYDVDGEPTVWRSPFTGWTPGVVVKLKSVTG